MPRRPSDANLFVKLSRRSIYNEEKSYGIKHLGNDGEVVQEIIGAGKPVHDNVDYIHIEIPGDRDNIVERPVTCCDKKVLSGEAPLTSHCRARKGLDDKPMIEECDLHRFFDEYAAFKSGQEMHAEGTDLKGWPGIDPASVEELAYSKVYTVEQLSTLNDSLVGRFGGLRQRALDYLETAKKTAAAINVRAELDSRDAQIKALIEQGRVLQEQVAALSAAQAKPATKSTSKEMR